jgi:phenylacetate-CoA ligase
MLLAGLISSPAHNLLFGSFMELRSAFTHSVLFPLLMRRWHPQAQRYLAELQKYEFAAAEDVQAAQWQRVRALIEHAARHVPYYRKLFAEHGIRPQGIQSPGDYLRIPVLPKATLQTRVQELIAENRDKSEGQANASGGSTGKPVQFFQDAEYWNRAYASLWFVESWWGIRPGDRTASLWGADRDIPDQSWKERLFGAIAQTRVCNAFALTGPQMEAFAKMLARWRPRHIIGYASAIEIFARFLLERPEFRIRPAAVKTTADVLGDESRRLIEAALGCPVYNFYGSREINNLAVECPARRGLHVNALTRYIEIVDDAGNPQPPHHAGRILLTDLTNRFMPLLRYEIEDIGSWAGESCSCGRPFPLLERVWGRSSDFIVTPEGKLIHSVFFTHLFYDMPEVALFQINQRQLHEVDVLLVLRPGTNGYPAELLRLRLNKAFGPEMRITVQVVSEIKRPPSGKHRFTVSSVRPSWTQEKSTALEANRVAVS